MRSVIKIRSIVKLQVTKGGQQYYKTTGMSVRRPLVIVIFNSETNTHTHARTHAHVYTRIHTHTYTHIYTHTRSRKSRYVEFEPASLGYPHIVFYYKL